MEESKNKKDVRKIGKKSDGRKLTQNEISFCQEYVKAKGNATQAYKNSSYSSDNMTNHTIRNSAYKLLQNDDILTTIEKIQEKAKKKVEEEIAFGLKDTVQGIIKLAKEAKSDNNKLKAFDMLMKHFGGYEEDNRQQKDEVNIPITNWINKGTQGGEEDFDEAFNELD